MLNEQKNELQAAAAAPVVASGELMREKFGEWYKRQFGYDLGSDFDNDDGMQARHWATWQAAIAAAPASPAAPVAPSATQNYRTGYGDGVRAAAKLCDAKYQARVESGHPREASTARALAEEIRNLQSTAPVAQPADERADVPGDDDTQEWARLTGAVAWHLIDRHGEDWNDIGNKMEAWGKARFAATPAAPLAQQSEPVGWWRTAVICDDAGYAIGLDEPEFQRGAESPGDDIDGVWYPLYAGSAPASPVPELTKEWCAKMADLEIEADCNIEAGARIAAPASTGPCSDDTAKDAEEFAYSTDEESYQGGAATREAAIDEAIHETDADVTTIWTGRITRFKPSGIADYVIEQLQEQAHDECDEWAENYLTAVTKEEEAELDRLILDWAARVETPSFFTVNDTQQHDISDRRAALSAAEQGGK